MKHVLFDKLRQRHQLAQMDDGPSRLQIDSQLAYAANSPQTSAPACPEHRIISSKCVQLSACWLSLALPSPLEGTCGCPTGADTLHSASRDPP